MSLISRIINIFISVAELIYCLYILLVKVLLFLSFSFLFSLLFTKWWRNFYHFSWAFLLVWKIGEERFLSNCYFLSCFLFGYGLVSLSQFACFSKFIFYLMLNWEAKLTIYVLHVLEKELQKAGSICCCVIASAKHCALCAAKVFDMQRIKRVFFILYYARLFSSLTLDLVDFYPNSYNWHCDRQFYLDL